MNSKFMVAVPILFTLFELNKITLVFRMNGLKLSRRLLTKKRTV